MAPVLPLGLKITNAGQSFGSVSKHSGRPPDERTLFTVTWSTSEHSRDKAEKILPCHRKALDRSLCTLLRHAKTDNVMKTLDS